MKGEGSGSSPSNGLERLACFAGRGALPSDCSTAGGGGGALELLRELNGCDMMLMVGGR